MPGVTAVVVVHNGSGLIPSLAASLSDLPDVHAVFFDSDSADDSCGRIASLLPRAELLHGPNRGFGYGNNRCIEKVKTEYTLLLNSDASISGESLDQLVSFLESHGEYAGVQPVVRLSGWEIVTASRGVFLTEYGEAWDSGFLHLEPFIPPSPLDVPGITAAVSLWRTDVLRDIGGFDEGFFMYFEDADLSLRARVAGWKLAVVRSSAAKHMVGASSTRKLAGMWELQSSVRMFRRYLGDGGLKPVWWKRELRMIAAMLARGISPANRIRTSIKAMQGKVRPVELPGELMSVLFGSPLDMPFRRPEPGAPGPGWKGDKAAPWAGISPVGEELSIVLSAGEHAVTGVVLNDLGGILKRFTVPANGSTEYKLAVPPGVVYIKCDSVSDELKVVIDGR